MRRDHEPVAAERAKQLAFNLLGNKCARCPESDPAKLWIVHVEGGRQGSGSTRAYFRKVVRSLLDGEGLYVLMCRLDTEVLYSKMGKLLSYVSPQHFGPKIIRKPRLKDDSERAPLTAEDYKRIGEQALNSSSIVEAEAPEQETEGKVAQDKA